MDRRTCPSVVAVKILLLCTAYTDVTKLLPSVLYPNRVDHVCGECVLQAVGMGKDARGYQPVCNRHGNLVKPNAADVRHGGQTASGEQVISGCLSLTHSNNKAAVSGISDLKTAYLGRSHSVLICPPQLVC